MSLTTASKSPFQTMDIKSAFLTGGRKRKASLTQICVIDSKNPKLSANEEDDSPSDPLRLQTENVLSECKENTDLNVTEIKQSSDEKQLHETESGNKAAESSSDEINVSFPNSSINTSLNTSALSLSDECAEDNLEQSTGTTLISNSEKNDDTLKKHSVPVKKMKRKMTPEEAKKRAAERELMKESREKKKIELETKKKEKIIEKERKQREREIRKEREESERKERERLKQEERIERERLKQEKKEQEEKERLQKIKEREEKIKIRQMMLEHKLEEKKRKEGLKLKREEELKKAEEEKRLAKLEKEQKQKEKKEKAKANFVKFFIKEEIQPVPVAPQINEKEGAFLPFQISGDMILAPAVPLAAQERFDKTRLDKFLQLQDAKELYLQILKSGRYQEVRCRKKNKKLKTCDSDVIVIDEKVQADLHLKAKLLQFCENVRPPYWGTWRKKSRSIRPRNPFAEDEVFDYSVDSDDEWDEGGPGESLSGTENEDESEDEYEVDNEFFVPHGYLSEEENDDEEEETNDPEKKKALLKIKLQEFERERKQKTTELKPLILGCFFENDSCFKDNGLHNILRDYEAQLISNIPIPTRFTISKSKVCCSNSPSSNVEGLNTLKKKIQYVPEDAMPDLIRLVHGNYKKRSFLVEEFQQFWSEQISVKEQIMKKESLTNSEGSEEIHSENVVPDPNLISKRQLNITIKKISMYGRSPNPLLKKPCWWVHDDVLEKYKLTDVPIPNQWKYTVDRNLEELPQKSNSTSIKGFLIA